MNQKEKNKVEFRRLVCEIIAGLSVPVILAVFSPPSTPKQSEFEKHDIAFKKENVEAFKQDVLFRTRTYNGPDKSNYMGALGRISAQAHGVGLDCLFSYVVDTGKELAKVHQHIEYGSRSDADFRLQLQRFFNGASLGLQFVEACAAVRTQPYGSAVPRKVPVPG